MISRLNTPMQRGNPPTDARSTLVLRNVVVRGTRTSMRLEQAMWDALHEIAAHERTNINEIVTRVSRSAKQSSRTSAVRVFIMSFYRDQLKRVVPQRFQPTLVYVNNERRSARG